MQRVLQLLEKAYWVAAIWDIEMMFACDYANSKVFAFTMNNDGSFGDEIVPIFVNEGGYYYASSGRGIGVAQKRRVAVPPAAP